MHTDSLPGSPDGITPQWLTEHLRACGALEAGAVEAVRASANTRWNVAETAFLSLRYTPHSKGDLPESCFAKITTQADPLEHLLPGEYAFYTAPETAELPVPRCYVALRDPATGGTVLLLEDMRPTHEATAWPLPPALPRCEAAIRALAQIHAASWTRHADAAALSKREEQLAAQVQTLLPPFLDATGDRLSTQRRALLAAACAQYASLKQRRLTSDAPLCRIHGDAHFWNVLYPKDAERGGCVLIDWEDWRIDFAASDLALMIALHWYPERRARHETPLLRAYHDALCEAGVEGYSLDALRADYRLAHLCNAIIPIFQHDTGNPHASWWSNLERWFMGVDDLDCRALL